MRARSQTLFLGTQAPLTLSPLPRLSLSLNFNMSRDQPEYGISQALCFLTPSVLGLGWALPEGIRGCSLTWGLEGDFGAALRPGGNNRKSDRKRNRGLFAHGASASQRSRRTLHLVWCSSTPLHTHSETCFTPGRTGKYPATRAPTAERVSTAWEKNHSANSPIILYSGGGGRRIMSSVLA